jgi:hypothetical protein
MIFEIIDYESFIDSAFSNAELGLIFYNSNTQYGSFKGNRF